MLTAIFSLAFDASKRVLTSFNVFLQKTYFWSLAFDFLQSALVWAANLWVLLDLQFLIETFYRGCKLLDEYRYFLVQHQNFPWCNVNIGMFFVHSIFRLVNENWVSSINITFLYRRKNFQRFFFETLWILNCLHKMFTKVPLMEFVDIFFIRLPQIALSPWKTPFTCKFQVLISI